MKQVQLEKQDQQVKQVLQAKLLMYQVQLAKQDQPVKPVQQAKQDQGVQEVFADLQGLPV